ncbi:hypothetical protein ALC56_10212 [Trachymyrmex septentrionalis]|uniref:Uncharacterized protein n=1 Tax=Trachymyrmex septentrionalis TaxID=34720 RepID=A0A151JTZ0_9HYME|nr:hypothetical protein ALC56_10212 [Trachymyrmex septentrionalis]
MNRKIWRAFSIHTGKYAKIIHVLKNLKTSLTNNKIISLLEQFQNINNLSSKIVQSYSFTKIG